MPKTIKHVEPFMLCKPISLQQKIGEIIIPGMEEKKCSLKKVVKASASANARGINDGDIVVTKQVLYLSMPTQLTENDEFPFTTKDIETLELIDPAQVIAKYSE